MKLEKKSFEAPDEKHPSGRGVVDAINLGGITTRRLTFQPGWRWSEDVKPEAKTNSCQYAHLTIHVSGQIAVHLDDGTEMKFGPGDVGLIPPGHDAWVIGNEPAVIIEQTPTEN
ncbi:MAG TPA: cupin domain-containing protein [Candidatus Saccharimonadales bacterium]|nr:cupin domain-containing protein [Candidatus Saccharimonadales bacterium]